MERYKLTKMRHRFPDNSLKDITGTIQKELQQFYGLIKSGTTIAIAVGSRGIDNLPLIVKETVDFTRQQGAKPFIVPAMGSHGGATAEGQAEVLAGYGITESAMGVPIRPSMEVVELPKGNQSHPVYMDRNAYDADGIILINKIKPHTDFHSTYESGLVKMAVIGLGKEKGAKAIHHFGIYGLSQLITVSAKKIFALNKILGGIALVENAHDKTMLVKVIPGKEILNEEPNLLSIACANRPSFPADNIDVLIIDRMGKNISGVGIDTNIIGRIKIYGQEEPEFPKIKSIMVADLTEESHGNATGVGLADVVTRRLFEKIDFDITYKNISTSNFMERAKIPFIAENDEDAFELALRNCGAAKAGKERIIRIRDTLHMDELYVSDAILNEIRNNPQIEQTGERTDIFDDFKTLVPF